MARRQVWLVAAQEWWHFTLANEPFPNTAFDFEIRRAP
jgi:D-alanyl-D-alanine dipeptidase